MMFLIVGAYLIAGAVKESGLGERIAYKFIISYVTSFKSIIVAIFILTFYPQSFDSASLAACFPDYVSYGGRY